MSSMRPFTLVKGSTCAMEAISMRAQEWNFFAMSRRSVETFARFCAL